MVEFQANGGTAGGYLAVPASGPGPGVLVVQEWWGPGTNDPEHTAQACARTVTFLQEMLG
jgi:dienelactone hydrolase